MIFDPIYLLFVAPGLALSLWARLKSDMNMSSPRDEFENRTLSPLLPLSTPGIDSNSYSLT